MSTDRDIKCGMMDKVLIIGELKAAISQYANIFSGATSIGIDSVGSSGRFTFRFELIWFMVNSNKNNNNNSS